jgi:arylformamidase
MTTRTYDVTVPLSPALPAFPGDPRFEMQAVQSLAAGDPYNAASLRMGTHAGTHVDAPRHFLPEGLSVDQLPLEMLIGKARLIEVPAFDAISRKDLAPFDLRDDLRLLIKTRMSGQLLRGEFDEDFVHLAEDAARYLVQAGIKLVGIDSLSIDRFGDAAFPAHHVLLGAGVVVVEGLDLSDVPEGQYDLACLPLRIFGADGAPARVVLRARG